jgi:AcrR family transcriptional regulator
MMHTGSTHVNRKTAQREATRARLLDAARRLFAAKGYAAVGTEEVVRAAGVTRGALYHQFSGKEDLFAAVLEDVETRLVDEAAGRMQGATDPLEALRAGMRGWLAVCERPEAQRIVLLDAPAVLGWERWRKVGEAHGLGVTMAGLEAAMAAGVIARQPVRALAHVLVAALNEAALYIARAEDQSAARGEMAEVLDRLVDGLRRAGA